VEGGRARVAGLRRGPATWMPGCATLLEAGVARASGDDAAAVARLAAAEDLLVAAELHLMAMAARRQRGRVVGGSDGAALIATADRWMTAQGIGDPARMASTMAPGFGRD